MKKTTREQHILQDRKASIVDCQHNATRISCEKDSVSGAVSQRACVYCGARVVLNPITDAYHIVHGPIGCASYTWDIRGSLSSGSELFRNSFSTDLEEKDVIFGGEKKLTAAIDELMENASPRPSVIFVYATCIVGVIGDDVEAVCKSAQHKYALPVIPVKAPGFSGTKSLGYKMACDAMMQLLTPHYDAQKEKELGINILGDFNLAGEMWLLKKYFKHIGIKVFTGITGDSSYASLINATKASLNIVQCAGSSSYLANRMESEFGIPFIKVSFFGIEDTSDSIIRTAQALGRADIIEKAKQFVAEKSAEAQRVVDQYKPRLEGKKAAIYVGGGFKAISLIRQLNELGVEAVVVGTQTGKNDEYEVIENLANPGTVILDDANPAELELFMLTKSADILIGGVKERPLAYKLGLAFCDHNHERKHSLAGYEGVKNFAEELNLSMNSPVWSLIKTTGGQQNG